MSVWVASVLTPALPEAALSTGKLSFSSKCCAGIYLILVWVEVVMHEGLVAILEDGQVLELLQVPWDVGGADEETGEEHEWDDKHWGKSDC